MNALVARGAFQFAVDVPAKFFGWRVQINGLEGAAVTLRIRGIGGGRFTCPIIDSQRQWPEPGHQWRLMGAQMLAAHGHCLHREGPLDGMDIAAGKTVTRKCGPGTSRHGGLTLRAARDLDEESVNFSLHLADVIVGEPQFSGVRRIMGTARLEDADARGADAVGTVSMRTGRKVEVFAVNGLAAKACL